MTPSAKMLWRRQTVADFNLVVSRYASSLRAAWTDLDTIVEILSDVADSAPHSHMFFPVSGGLDLRGAKRSHEEDCLELSTEGQTIAIAKPNNLQLERFPEDRTGDWTYLRLNLAPLTPTDYHRPQDESYSEEVAELAPGVYEERSAIDDPGSPAETRVVTRLFRGALVLFAKGSLYNQDSSTYDGRHSLGLVRQYGREGTPELFRAIIGATIDGLAPPST